MIKNHNFLWVYCDKSGRLAGALIVLQAGNIINGGCIGTFPK